MWENALVGNVNGSLDACECQFPCSFLGISHWLAGMPWQLQLPSLFRQGQTTDQSALRERSHRHAGYRRPSNFFTSTVRLFTSLFCSREDKTYSNFARSGLLMTLNSELYTLVARSSRTAVGCWGCCVPDGALEVQSADWPAAAKESGLDVTQQTGCSGDCTANLLHSATLSVSSLGDMYRSALCLV